MAVQTSVLNVSTKGNTDIIDITEKINVIIRKSGFSAGIVTVFVPGSTAGISTIEYEPGLLKDIKLLFQKIIPEHEDYAHDKAWHDGNGHSHLRASLLGPSVTVPFTGKTLLLGTWQQVILVDFDNRRREREIILQIIGEP
ncbi:MAG: secondary thiamine-phosphate synthase enzyme YjbQ [bacterium]|nr:secondary thiamine-phosphate synthase enzyme YjbQ [bacterium]